MKHSRSKTASRDRGSFLLIWAVCLSSIGGAILAANKLPGAALPAGKSLYIAGIFVFALGLLLRCYAIIYLGRFFTPNVAILTDHRLIDSGPYRFVRHPTYAGFLLIIFGIGLSFANVASLLIVIFPILVCILWRIRIEERALTEAFGEQYRTYARRTKRLIPFVY